MADNERRVLVTGLGLVTPLGSGIPASWPRLQRGDSATRWLAPTELWPAEVWSHVPAEAEELAPFAGAPAPFGLPLPLEERLREITGGETTVAEPVIRLAVQAAAEALDNAGLGLSANARRVPAGRMACVVGSSKGGLTSFARACVAHLAEQSLPRECDSPHGCDGDGWWPFLPNAAAASVAGCFGLEGPCLCPVAACATGLISLIRGFDLIRNGDADVVLCGSADASLQLPVLAAFRRLGVLARGFDDPAGACRPFDVTRNGFVVGEGAGMLVLEAADHARARGASPVARMRAGVSGADLSGATSVEAEPVGLVHLLHSACDAAAMTPDRLQALSLHGTATVANDQAESRAVRQAFGPAADGIACTGLKGGLGHLLGAAGSVETVALLLGMRDSVVPPIVNLRQPAAECDLPLIAGQPLRREQEFGLKLSLGFGGQLAAAVFSRA